MTIPEEAFRAASERYQEVLTRLRLAEGGGFKVASQHRRAITAALEAAAPFILEPVIEQNHRLSSLMIAQSNTLQDSMKQIQAHALRQAAADTRARGDIGKDGGCEAWDYLTWRADRIEKGEP
jgi:hypothetical protein